MCIRDRTIAGNASNEIYPDVGGEAGPAEDDVIVVWDEVGAGIQGRQVTVPSTGDPFNLGGFTVSTLTDATDPAISQSGGEPGNLMVVFEAPGGGSLFHRNVFARVVDRNGNLLTATTVVASGSPVDEEDADVDGDGTYFMLVYEREDLNGSGDNDVYGKPLRFTGTAIQQLNAEQPIEADAGDDEVEPAVGWTGEAYVVAYSDEVVGSDYDILVKSVDPYDCYVCEGEQALATSSDDQDLPAVATQRGGSTAAGDEALVVWESRDAATLEGELWSRLYRTDAGVVADLGGGCGSGGEAVAGCATVGNADFRHRLIGAEPSEQAFLVLGTERLDLSCGLCTLVPDPYTSFVYGPVSTGLFGNATIVMPIPSTAGLAGQTVIEQWVVPVTSGACSFLQSDLSNAIEVEIE